jgi:hypothetical protein
MPESPLGSGDFVLIRQQTDRANYFIPCTCTLCIIIIGHCTCASSVVYVHARTQDDDFAASPLGLACRSNQLQVVKTLIENGVMINYRDKVCLDLYISFGYTLITVATCAY